MNINITINILLLVHHERRCTEADIITIAQAVSVQGNTSSCIYVQIEKKLSVKGINGVFTPFEEPEHLLKEYLGLIKLFYQNCFVVLTG